MSKYLILLVMSLSLFACSSSSSKKKPDLPSTHHVISTKHFPEKTYYPARWVRSPRPAPIQPEQVERGNITAEQKILPAFHYDFRNSSLCEIAAGIAASMKFSAYCSSKLAKRRHSLNRIGTPFEIRDILAREANINIIIDLPHREIRFLEKDLITPRFYNEY